MSKKNLIEVNAVLDTEFENLLKQTNQYEKIIKGQIKCKNCGTIITTQNIGIIKPQKNNTGEVQIEFYCDKLECSQNLTV